MKAGPHVDPLRIAVALALLGMLMTLGVALFLGSGIWYFVKVAFVSFGILLALGYLVGIIVRELADEYRMLRGVIHHRNDLKTPISRSLNLKEDSEAAPEDEEKPDDKPGETATTTDS